MEIITILAELTRPMWKNIQILLIGAILFQGVRSSLLIAQNVYNQAL